MYTWMDLKTNAKKQVRYKRVTIWYLYKLEQTNLIFCCLVWMWNNIFIEIKCSILGCSGHCFSVCICPESLICAFKMCALCIWVILHKVYFKNKKHFTFQWDLASFPVLEPFNFSLLHTHYPYASPIFSYVKNIHNCLYIECNTSWKLFWNNVGWFIRSFHIWMSKLSDIGNCLCFHPIDMCMFEPIYLYKHLYIYVYIYIYIYI
jgi:hypothetical protein